MFGWDEAGINGNLKKKKNCRSKPVILQLLQMESFFLYSYCLCSSLLYFKDISGPNLKLKTFSSFLHIFLLLVFMDNLPTTNKYGDRFHISNLSTSPIPNGQEFLDTVIGPPKFSEGCIISFGLGAKK